MLSLTRHRRVPTAAVLAAAVVLPLAACSDEPESVASRERTTRTDVAFTGCEDVECTGEIDGAPYEILLPETWNGTLLLYSHGYRQAEAAPPTFSEPSREPEPAPGWSSGTTEVGDALLEQGYALAGSAYASNGWAVEDGVEAGEALHEFFVENVGTPDRVYVWGDSLGGLITQLLAERNPDWVTAAAPLCGVMAGPNANLDLGLDVAYAVRTLLLPDMRLTGFSSWQEATEQWQAAYDAVLAAGTDVQAGVPKLLAISAVVDGPTATGTYDGSTVESGVRARAEGILTALGFATYGRYDIEQRFGGNPSANDDVDYAARLDAEERALIDTVGGARTADALAAALEGGQRVEADAGARQRFADSGTPTGAVQDPTITMHTAADPLVVVQNQSVFEDRVAANPDRTGDLVQLFTVAPPTFDAEQGAPYGAGHCNFSLDERVGVVDLLDRWAREGVYPAPAAVTAAFGDDTGYEPAYRPEPWPADLDG
ncbi:hypothetical protein [Thalassiella azotivora]